VLLASPADSTTIPDVGDRPPRSRLRTWILRLVIALVLLLAIVGGLIAAAPWLARPTIEQALGAALGKPVSITALRWDAANRSVVAEGVTVGEAPDLFGVERITVRANPTAFDRRHLVIDLIAVEKPFGAVSLDNQYRPALGAAADTDGGPPSVPLALTVREVVVGAGTILVRRPEPGAPSATVALERLSASDVEFADGVLSFSGALAATVNGAPLSGETTVRLAADDRTIRATLTAKKLPIRAGVVPLPAAVESLTGTLEATVELDITDQPPRQDLRLALRLANARLSGPRGAQLAAGSIALPKARVDLRQRRIDLGPVTVETPQLTIDLAADAEQAAAPADTPSEPQWSLRTDTVTVRGGELRARRGDAAATLRLDTVRWQGLRDTPTTLSLTARAADGGRLQADGTVSVEPFGFDLALRAEALSVASWARLFELPLYPARGSITGNLRLDYRDGLRRIEGTLRAADLHSAPPDPARPTEVMAVATAEATFAVVPDGTPAVEVSALRLDYPYAMVVHSAAGTFPYSVVGRRAAADDPAPAAPAAAMPEVRVRRVAIDNGKLEFVDETLAPPFWTSLTGLTGNAEEIALPALTVERFALSGKRDELSPVQIAGTLTADGLQGQVAVQDILLDSLNAYIAPVLGYRVVSGRLSTVATATSVPSLLQSTAEVVLNGLDVTQIGDDVIYQQSGVPLPIALGLIASPSGQIDLTLPLSVDTSSGQIAVGSVVWQAVRKAIVTALTSPLRILGDLFGGKGAPHAFAIDPIPFATGSAAIDAAAALRIGEIARILAAQPGLLLVIQPQLTADDIGAVGDAGAAELAAERNDAVRDAFVDAESGPSLPAKRLILAPWKPATGADATGRPGVYVELQDAA
jgi:hypothetical protein